MIAKRLLARLDALENTFYREAIAMDRLKERSDEILLACEELELSDAQRSRPEFYARKRAVSALSDLSFSVSDFSEVLVATAQKVADVAEDLSELVPAKK